VVVDAGVADRSLDALHPARITTNVAAHAVRFIRVEHRTRRSSSTRTIALDRFDGPMRFWEVLLRL